VPVAALSLISLLDDLKGLPVLLRLGSHLAAALAVALAIWPADIAVCLGVAIAIAWMTNLYNFMDGADGLAGTMAVSGFSSYAYAAWLAGLDDLTIAATVIAAGSAAFLLFNFPPARI